MAARAPAAADGLEAAAEAEFPLPEVAGAEAEAEAAGTATLRQLEQVVAFAERHCPDRPAAARELTFGDVVERVFRPLAASSGRGFAERLARPAAGPAGPTWCVGCGPAVRTAELLAGARAHAGARGLPEGAALWLPQLALPGLGPVGAGGEAAAGALRRAEGLVLVLDDGAAALRDPGCAALAVACLRQGRKLDLVSSSGVVLADGLTTPELAEEADKYAGAGLRSKADREKLFPLDVLRAGLAAELEGAGEEGRRSFRALFAAGGWRAAVDAGAAELLPQLSEALAADASRECLLVCLAFCGRATSDVAEAVGKAVAPSVGSLFVDLSCCEKLGDDGVRAIAGRLPGALRSLTLLCWRCERLTNVSVAAVADALPAQLELLELNFTGCRKVTAAAIEHLVSKLPASTRTLRLLFPYAQISDAGLLAVAAQLPLGLRELSLDFAECQGIGDPGVQGLARSLPAGLERLRFSARGCAGISDKSVVALARGLPSGLTALTVQLKETGVSPEKVKMCSDLQAMREHAASSKSCCALQ